MSMPKVTIKSCSTVRPSDPTWSVAMALSEWDQTGYLTHVPIIYFYRPSNTWFSPPSAIADTLKHSLSRVLVPFYPLAGRLQWIGNGRLQLQCNAMGVQFIEAECESNLDDLGDLSLLFQPSNLFPSVDYNLPIHELPLCLVQLTRFKCGGIGIAMANSHVVVDGKAAFHFISEWARLARGDPLETVPFLDRSVFRAGQPPLASMTPSLEDYPQYQNLPLLLGQLDNSDERRNRTIRAILRITKSQIEHLRKMANDANPMARGFTRYETICGHLWKTACKARGLKKEQPTSLIIVIDSRTRMRPPIPTEYFGTANFHVIAQSVVGDLLSKPLGFAASKVRETIEKVTNEYVRSCIELLKNQKDLTKFQNIHNKEGPPFYGNPNFKVISWLTFPVYGFDFGWGKGQYMGLTSHNLLDGNCLLLRSPEGDGSVMVFLCLQEAHMNAFEKHFYENIKEEV